jgi:uncharacterized protein (TIGR03790 family)
VWEHTLLPSCAALLLIFSRCAIKQRISNLLNPELMQGRCGSARGLSFLNGFPAITVAVILSACPLHSQTAENVLLILNEASPTSLEVGQYYAQKRGIPFSNVLKIKTTTDDSIAWRDFDLQINIPIANWLVRNFAQDRILYIIRTKGVPLRIEGTSGSDGTTASVDSELTLLYRKMVGQAVSPAGSVRNPYYLDDKPIASAKPFTHEGQDIYLVSRLDGYSSLDIKGLIDRGFAPSREGKILLDEKESLTDKGNLWLEASAEILKKMGFQDRAILESTGKVLTGEKGVLGYYSWGSNDPSIRIRHFGLGWIPGALAGMFVSTDGRTMSEPPQEWKPGTWEDKSTYYAGSPQSMAGDLIRDGITGVAAHVGEPYLEATIRPNILFPAYLSGFNLIESYYLAMPYLGWQTIVIGDPLCAPFRTREMQSVGIDRGKDPQTELPFYFGTRRLRNLSFAAYKQAAIHPDTIMLLLRAEARIAKQDIPGVRQALEEATSRDSRLAGPQLQLAVIYEQSAEYDKAIERYRRVLELSPDSAAVLNNLAYALAVKKNVPREGLPLAEKAYALAKNANIGDTLGWIYHLLGENDKAIILLEEAATEAAKNAEIHLHVAVVRAALGDRQAAAVALKKALNIDNKLESREDVVRLRTQLQQK